MELTCCIDKTLKPDPIAASRVGLIAEFPVFANDTANEHENAASGVLDVLTLTPAG